MELSTTCNCASIASLKNFSMFHLLRRRVPSKAMRVLLLRSLSYLIVSYQSLLPPVPRNPPFNECCRGLTRTVSLDPRCDCERLSSLLYRYYSTSIVVCIDRYDFLVKQKNNVLRVYNRGVELMQPLKTQLILQFSNWLKWCQTYKQWLSSASIFGSDMCHRWD